MSDDTEINGYKGISPVDEDPLFFWRLNDDFRVPDAAILITGNDPSAKEIRYDDLQGHAYYDTEGNFIRDQKRDYEGFDAVFSALKSAIRKGTLKATLVYGAQLSSALPYADGDDRVQVLSSTDLWKHLDQTKEQAITPFDDLVVHKEPDWENTTIAEDDLKRWLRSKRFSSSFFFSEADAPSGQEYLEPTHERFSPELAAAVAAWQALIPERKFKTSPKAAIESWLISNPDVWQGAEPMSSTARERIATLVNWNRIGGAPKSGG
ncbi:hypothetical protein AL036_06500 [Salipiger aestuarii]|uniref:hypothetical protein n=1 Tax=Salipiger aestuarii TaxID=568098 RepID=UPI00123BB870|nr:hypothetical protein [Salipiger aestuarii]KAA8608536.1 hypothetical protein AL036_06500 [Salipiger aestuarii]